jgi:hypothetical protein
MFFHRTTPLLPGLAAALALLSGCSNHHGPSEDVDTTMDSLVTAEWLMENLDDPNLVVLDATVVVTTVVFEPSMAEQTLRKDTFRPLVSRT